jgi:DNA-directed RNA polymerase specialized sigma24 family protein
LSVSQEPFDIFLSWLDEDRDAAGIKYEQIRKSLIRIFISHGFDDAEDLADVTINRVTIKIPEMISTYVGEPTPFFYAVARNVAHEARRRKEIATDEIPEKAELIRDLTDEKVDCLVGCLSVLPNEKQELINDYYLYEGKDKIIHHRQMAQERGITDGALRTRAHSIRVNLEKCVVKCTKRLNQKQKPIWGALLKRPGLRTATSKERQP